MNRTFFFDNVFYSCGAAVAGKKEGEGPLKEYFDKVVKDDKFGEESFEKAERKFFSTAISLATQKAGLEKPDMIIGGDLLNQIISASFASRDFFAPFFGVYGACSTICESMLLGACLVSGGFTENVFCAASSHFSTAERQYRFPLDYGSQQTPTSQWTVTGAGCSVLTNKKSAIRICAGTVGKVIDLGIKDANNMGAAMAPAAADTICEHLRATGTTQNDYDVILTGDLGKLGKELAIELIKQNGFDVSQKINDCGCMIFYPEQNAPMGASGCGCASVVFNGFVKNQLEQGKIKSVLLAATGALLSPTSSFQGENIPGISYALSFRREQ